MFQENIHIIHTCQQSKKRNASSEFLTFIKTIKSRLVAFKRQLWLPIKFNRTFFVLICDLSIPAVPTVGFNVEKFRSKNSSRPSHTALFSLLNLHLKGLIEISATVPLISPHCMHCLVQCLFIFANFRISFMTKFRCTSTEINKCIRLDEVLRCIFLIYLLCGR